MEFKELEAKLNNLQNNDRVIVKVNVVDKGQIEITKQIVQLLAPCVAKLRLGQIDFLDTGWLTDKEISIITNFSKADNWPKAHEDQGSNKQKVYVVFERIEVDGGYGDAIPTEQIRRVYANEVDANNYVQEHDNPHVYDRPYDDLYEGGLSYIAMDLIAEHKEIEDEEHE